MTDPTAYYLQPLSWHQVATKPESYELRAIPGPVASLTLRSKHEAIAQSPGVEWLFRTKGIFRRVADVRLLPSEKLLATCRLGYWSSTGVMQVSPSLTLTFTASTWDTSYSVKTGRGELVLSYDFRGFFSLRAPLAWGTHPGPADQLPWLVPFGWFLAVRHYRDVVEAAGAIVITG